MDTVCPCVKVVAARTMPFRCTLAWSFIVTNVSTWAFRWMWQFWPILTPSCIIAPLRMCGLCPMRTLTPINCCRRCNVDIFADVSRNGAVATGTVVAVATGIPYSTSFPTCSGHDSAVTNATAFFEGGFLMAVVVTKQTWEFLSDNIHNNHRGQTWGSVRPSHPSPYRPVVDIPRAFAYCTQPVKAISSWRGIIRTVWQPSLSSWTQTYV